MTTTISLNQKFNFQFVCSVREYEADLILLRRLGFKPSYEDVTKENSPLGYAEGRPEVLFNIEVKNVSEASFIREALHRGSK